MTADHHGLPTPRDSSARVLVTASRPANTSIRSFWEQGAQHSFTRAQTHAPSHAVSLDLSRTKPS